MKRTIKTEGIVLRKRSLPNQDWIVTIFCKELGKVNVFAKGIKKITSRRLPHVQTANLINTILYKKDDRFYLQESSLISGFAKIKNSKEKLNRLYLFLFVLERILPENQSETQTYILCKRFFIDLSKYTEQNSTVINNYLNELLSLLGYIKESRPFEETRLVVEEIIHEKLPPLDIM